jgi:A/G-specific adenine glycosylase
VDIGANAIDYVARVSIVGTSGGQGGKEAAELRGVTVPVKITGPLDAPRFRADLGSAARDVAKEKAQEKIKEEKEQLRDRARERARDRLKDLFAVSAFARALVRWQARHGRHGLPWQATRDPYRIWLSEVMLQQTQVATVIPYFERFVARFPDVESLALGTLDEVLALWSGLGYYSRARNLHAAAGVVVESYRGRWPRTREGLASLPGVGRSTAAAVAVFAFGAREAILDGNVKRVLARHFAVRGYPGDRRVENRLWKIAEEHLPTRNIERYTQALMDLGASLCTRRQLRARAAH